MLNLPKEFIVFDTEYTCWQGSELRNWQGPGEAREIVHIGAVRIEAHTLAEKETFEAFARPMKNPLLSEYFINLTGITQERIEREGVDFKTALEKFSEWSGGLALYCFGSDGDVLEENCGFAGISFPFTRAQFHDVREVFRKHGVVTDDYTSGAIVTAFGKPIRRKPHNALNDARTIVDGLRELESSEQ